MITDMGELQSYLTRTNWDSRSPSRGRTCQPTLLEKTLAQRTHSVLRRSYNDRPLHLWRRKGHIATRGVRPISGGVSLGHFGQWA